MAEENRDEIEELGAAMRSLGGDIATAVREAVAEVTTPLLEEIRALRPVAPEPEPVRDATLLPGGGIDPADSMRDIYDQLGYERGDFEFARIMMGAGGQVKGTTVIEPSEQFMAAFRANVFKNKRSVPWVADQNGRAIRAMDTAESGYGAELVGVQYVADLWEAARRTDDLVNLIAEIPMTAPTAYVPVDAGLPEMLLVAENTANNSSAYATSKTGSSRRTFTARKFTIHEMWSAEMAEDSIVPYIPFLRAKLGMSAGLHLGSAIYNGDTTNAGTGNINSDDADPADTRHYLAFDGIRHYWLVDDTGNGVNQAGAPTLSTLRNARLLMAGSNNSVNSLDNIAWDDPDNLVYVCDAATRYALMNFDEVKTVDRFGDLATIRTGKIQAIDGVPILSPGYATKAEADGKLSETASNNTLGHLTVFNRRGWLRGQLRQVQVFVDRVQGTDQFRLELYTRVAFQRWGTDVAAGVRNITV
jgi:HK97 family phage major capsid protein